MKIAVIIPARDEAETIGDVVRFVRSVVDGDVFVVDNGSADGTSEIAVTAGARVVRESVAGYGKACMSGVAAAADADVFVFMDGDGSDRPEDIKPLLQEIDRGADIALAVRRGDAVAPGSIAPAARFGNWLSGWLIALLWGRRLHRPVAAEGCPRRGPQVHRAPRNDLRLDRRAAGERRRHETDGRRSRRRISAPRRG